MKFIREIYSKNNVTIPFSSLFGFHYFVKRWCISVQTFKSSKHQRQAIRTIPVTIANVGYISKEIMAKIGKKNTTPAADQEKLIKSTKLPNEFYEEQLQTA